MFIIIMICLSTYGTGEKSLDDKTSIWARVGIKSFKLFNYSMKP